MKTIGLIGGMSWESTASHYRLINEGVKERLGGLHPARIILYSVDFAPVGRLQMAGDWNGAGIGYLPHPGPANPNSNRRWPELAEQALGPWLPPRQH